MANLANSGDEETTEAPAEETTVAPDVTNTPDDATNAPEETKAPDVTEEKDTKADDTKDPAGTDPVEDKGCASVLGLGAVASMTLLLAAAFVARKKD